MGIRRYGDSEHLMPKYAKDANGVSIPELVSDKEFRIEVETLLSMYLTGTETKEYGGMKMMSFDLYELTDSAHEVPVDGYLDMVNFAINVAALIRREQIYILDVFKRRVKKDYEQGKCDKETSDYVDAAYLELVRPILPYTTEEPKERY